MTYKKRKVFLLSLITVLALVYAGSFVFSPEKSNTRSASFVWLDPKIAVKADRIVINEKEQTLELIKENGQWFVLHNKNKYPVRQAGIKDFFDILTTRASWPVRSSSASSHSRFGLDETPDRRVTFYGENNVLLDILVNAAMGREVFLRQYGQNEVRSGENRIVSFITSSADNWFNLRLIPESESGKIDAGSVQRFSVYDKDESLIFSRRNRGWIVSSGETVIEDINSTGIENYLQTILNSQGDSFVDSVFSDDPAFNYSRIILELGTGKIITIRFTAPYENNYRLAHVSDSGYIYSIPMWVSNQVFRSLSSFERQ